MSVLSSAANLFRPARFHALTKDSRLRANEGMLAPLLYEMRASILKRELSCIVSGCAVDLMSAMLALARVGKIDWAVPDVLGWFLYDL